MWSRVGWEGKLKMQILFLSWFFLLFCNREIYTSAAMATKGKNGLDRDITLQKMSVLAAVTPVHRQNLGPESCQVWLLTRWIIYHCSSTCPCQSLTHSAVNLGILFPHITKKLKPMPFMTTNTFRNFLLSGTLGGEYLSGCLLGFTIISSANNGYCLLLDFKQWTESMPYNE